MNFMRKGSFWSINYKTQSRSWMWQKLLKYRDKAKAFHKIEVQNGNSTSFWYDNWSNMRRIIEITGPRGFIDLGIPQHTTVATALQSHRRRNHRSDQLNNIEETLMALRNRGVKIQEDVSAWRYKGDVFKHKFNAKSTWTQLQNPETENEWFRGIWFSHFKPKYSLFAWLAMHNRLSTGDKMLSWNNGANASCVLCNDPLEYHLLFKCRYSSTIWTSLAKWLLKRNFTKDWPRLVTLISERNQPRK